VIPLEGLGEGLGVGIHELLPNVDPTRYFVTIGIGIQQQFMDAKTRGIVIMRIEGDLLDMQLC
jgi:hypothetical protein